MLKRVLENDHGLAQKMQAVIGVTKTIPTMRERFYWVTCSGDIKEWCYKCAKCSVSNGSLTPRAPIRQYNEGGLKINGVENQIRKPPNGKPKSIKKNENYRRRTLF